MTDFAYRSMPASERRFLPRISREEREGRFQEQRYTPACGLCGWRGRMVPAEEGRRLFREHLASDRHRLVVSVRRLTA